MFVRFIKADPAMHGALRRLDWTDFARHSPGRLAMYKPILAALLALSLFALAGCASTQPQLPLQYGTLKLIETDVVSADEVLEHTDRLTSLVLSETPLSLGRLGDEARDLVGYADLAAFDRLLIDAILGDVGHRLALNYDSPLNDNHRLLILDALAWIEQAAVLAGAERGGP